MKLLIIFGPPAVGKMTVGHELEKITGLKLFHNHMSIELVVPFFDFGTKSFNRLVTLFRKEIFKEVANSNLKGIIFTFVWDFNLPSEKKYLNNIERIFKKVNAKIYYVELETNLSERLKRNKTAHRLDHKPTKRDVEKSEFHLLEDEKKHRMNSEKNEVHKKNYFKINNTRLSAKKTAQLIKEKFQL